MDTSESSGPSISDLMAGHALRGAIQTAFTRIREAADDPSSGLGTREIERQLRNVLKSSFGLKPDEQDAFMRELPLKQEGRRAHLLYVAAVVAVFDANDLTRVVREALRTG